jgi:DNA-directed RNA polymerase alpha subunit
MNKDTISQKLAQIRRLVDEVEVEVGVVSPSLNTKILKVFRPMKTQKARAITILGRYGVYTLGQLVTKTEAELMLYRCMGKTTVEYIQRELIHLGLKLKD